jgi:hypothetical protein
MKRLMTLAFIVAGCFLITGPAGADDLPDLDKLKATNKMSQL